jgi:hypothetical protein
MKKPISVRCLEKPQSFLLALAVVAASLAAACGKTSLETNPDARERMVCLSCPGTALDPLSKDCREIPCSASSPSHVCVECAWNPATQNYDRNCVLVTCNDVADAGSPRPRD